MKKKNLALLILIAATSISCSAPTCQRDSIKELGPIQLKHIGVNEYKCLSDAVYLKFKYNDIACNERLNTLTNVIKAHNK